MMHTLSSHKARSLPEMQGQTKVDTWRGKIASVGARGPLMTQMLPSTSPSGSQNHNGLADLL